MAQLFSRASGTLARIAAAGLVPAVAGAGGLVYSLYWSDWATRVGVPLEQPVPFSHEHHVSGLGIDCRYCHSTVETSGPAGMPSTETCMTCHSQVWTDAPLLAPVRQSFQTGLPLRWTRVSDLPGFAYFDHGIHLAKGINCRSCHGDVGSMPITYRAETLYMKFCLECHRDPGPRTGAPGEGIDTPWQILRRSEAGGKGTPVPVHPGKDCSTCHR